ncbi:MAG: hypothetical protein AAB373_02095 [Patescibacteria group bacterium]
MMKNKLLKLFLVLTIFSSIGATTVYATKYEPPAIPKPNTLVGPTQDGRNALTRNVLPKFAVILTGLTASLSLLFLVIAGVRFVTAYGKEDSVTNAKNQAIYAVLGLLVSLVAYTIVAIVSNLKFDGDETKPATSKEAPAEIQPDDAGKFDNSMAS